MNYGYACRAVESGLVRWLLQPESQTTMHQVKTVYTKHKRKQVLYWNVVRNDNLFYSSCSVAALTVIKVE